MEEDRRIKNINSELPLHIIHLIFSKLSFFNLPTCRLVSKTWNNLVLSCKFVNPPIQNAAFFAYIYRPYDSLYCIDFDSKHLKGMNIFASSSFHHIIKYVCSCNGLLFLVGILKSRGIFILNPMTNEFIKLPTFDGDRGIACYNYGFGFCPNTKQYKIARLSLCKKEELAVEIFAFGTFSGKWTQVHSLPPIFVKGNGVYFNGGLYWAGRHLERPAIGRSYWNVVFRFDVEDEKFEEISIPLVGQDEDYSYFDVQVFNAGLHLVRYNLKLCEYHVWKMEQDLWIVAFFVPIPKNLLQHPRIYYLQLIKVCEDGKILCLFGGFDLMLYDPRARARGLETFHQSLRIKKLLSVFQIESSVNFDPLHKILAGSGGLEAD